MGKGDFTPLSCLEAAERLIEICPGSFRSMWGWEHAAEVTPPPLYRCARRGHVVTYACVPLMASPLIR